jgi:hypothetical protein
VVEKLTTKDTMKFTRLVPPKREGTRLVLPEREKKIKQLTINNY